MGKKINMFMEFSKEKIEHSLCDRFEKVVETYPHRLAVKDGDYILTYDELNQATNRLAQAILEQRGECEESVAFLIEHGAAQIVAMFGILKSGKFYVPLDPSSPNTLNGYMLKDSQSHVIVTNNRNHEIAKELTQGEIQIIDIDQIHPDISSENPGLSISSDAISHLYYTSGSTGQPKGTIQNHRNDLHFIMTMTNLWSTSADDRIAHLIPCSFSASPMTIFGALLNGASVMPFDLKKHGFVQLVDWLLREQISIYFSVPSIFRQLTTTLEGTERFLNLRLIILGGETLHKTDVELYKTYFSQNCLLHNIIASTEALIIRYYAMNKETAITESIVPVGFSVEDKEIMLLDDDGNAAGVNEIGEISVKSRYLSPGYWRKPEITKTVFLPDPEGEDKRIYLTGDMGRLNTDGCLVHLGRKDSMVKIRGQRVEIGAIEKALLDIDNVRETVVMAREDRHGGKYLVAYIVMKSKSTIPLSTLRSALVKTLPDYMIPTFFMMLGQLPRTPSGKVDRQALPEPDWSRPKLGVAFISPRNEQEHQLVQICEEVLGIHPIGVNDNFFDLGGDSLSYILFFARIEKKFGQTLPIAAYLQNPTIENMARVLVQQQNEEHGSLPEFNIIHKTETGYHNIVKQIKTLLTNPSLSCTQKLVKSCNIFLQHIITIGPSFGDVVLPYSIGTILLWWFCGQRWVQRWFFRRQVRLVQQCLLSIDKSENTDKVIRHSITCNFWCRWRLSALSRYTPLQLNRWVTISRISILHQARRRGNGAILALSHFALAPFILVLINQMGIDDFFLVGRTTLKLGMMGLQHMASKFMLDINIPKHSLFTGQLYEGKQILERGGIMITTADGYQGKSGITCPFHDRFRRFPISFAELAVSTEVDVIPVVISMGMKGQVRVQFLDPLKAAGNNYQEHVESLVRQYVNILETLWINDLGNVQWSHLEHFLELPFNTKRKIP